MLLPWRATALFALTALTFAPAARALVVYGDVVPPPNASTYTSPPMSGTFSYVAQLWPYVAALGANNASGVYLGNGFVLTANHVNVVDSGIVINGVSYDRDLTYPPLQVTEPGTGTPAENVDLKLVKILNPPALATLPINDSPSDASASGTLIGWGVGKGAPIIAQGWNWGANSTQTERWGVNDVAGVTILTYSDYRYDALYTYFTPTADEQAQITLGDSGSALFAKFGSVYKLTGLATATNRTGAAYFNPPDASFFVRLAKYAPLMRYENWAAARLGNSTASITADPDHDGIGNLLEYAFHTDPNAAGVSALPQAGMEPGFVTLTYTKLMSATDRVTSSRNLPTSPAGTLPQSWRNPSRPTA